MSLLATADRDQGGLGYLFRPQPEGDVGIDGHVEVVDPETNEATGRIVGIQVKAGRSYFRVETDEGWLVGVRPSTMAYRQNYSVPVQYGLLPPKRLPI